MDRAESDDSADLTEEVIFSEPGWPLTENALKVLFMRLGRRADGPRLQPRLVRRPYACGFLLAHRVPIALKTMVGHTTHAMTNHYVQAVEGTQVIRSDHVSDVDAMELNVGRLRRGTRVDGHARARD